MGRRKGEIVRGAGAAIVFGGVVLFSAGVVAPSAGGLAGPEGEDAGRDALRIAEALRRWSADCGDELSRRSVLPSRLFGPGVQPEMGAFGDVSSFPLSGVLCRDLLGLGDAWRGPYMENVPVDPWGRAFVANLAALRGDGDFFVASAGPDGFLQTGQYGRISDADLGATVMR